MILDATDSNVFSMKQYSHSSIYTVRWLYHVLQEIMFGLLVYVVFVSHASIYTVGSLYHASDQKIYLAWLCRLCLKVTHLRAQLGDFVMLHNKNYIWLGCVDCVCKSPINEHSWVTLSCFTTNYVWSCYIKCVFQSPINVQSWVTLLSCFTTKIVFDLLV